MRQQHRPASALQYALGDAIDVTATSALFPYRMTSVSDYVNAQLART